MERMNPAGIRPESLAYALSRPDIVAFYRKANSCMLCRRTGVNQAGLCDSCVAMLSSRDHDLVTRYLAGVLP